MAILKLKVARSSRINPATKQKGFAARVLTNGTADFDDIVKEAGHNTTMHKAELRMAFELCIESVAEMLKQGCIVDLGPIGKLYPSCTSGCDVKPGLYFRPGDEVQAAVKAAKLVWAKASDEDEDDEEGGSTPAPSTPTTPETPENPGTGGDNTGGGDDDDSGVIS